MCHQPFGSPAHRVPTATISHRDAASTSARAVPADSTARAGGDSALGVLEPLRGPGVECAIGQDELTVAEAHRVMQRHRACAGTECRPRRAALRVLVDTGRYVLSTSRRHVHIVFGSVGIQLDYQCPHAVAEEFAKRMQAHPDASVTIDHDLHPDFPPLPCAGLWPGITDARETTSNAADSGARP